MNRPIFHRDAGFNFTGYRTPLSGRRSGFFVEFHPANREAWALTIVLGALAILGLLGLPLLVGEYFAIGASRVPTGPFAMIVTLLIGFGVAYLFSEPAPGPAMDAEASGEIDD